MPSEPRGAETIHQLQGDMQVPIGSAIITHSLQIDSLNARRGVIIGFNDLNQRFAVQLAGHDGQP
eukprot:10070082-Karenia_brevis.AAC.1